MQDILRQEFEAGSKGAKNLFDPALAARQVDFCRLMLGF
jgi:hypothetical protein